MKSWASYSLIRLRSRFLKIWDCYSSKYSWVLHIRNPFIRNWDTPFCYEVWSSEKLILGSNLNSFLFSKNFQIGKKHYWIAQLSFISKYCKLLAHIHNKVYQWQMDLASGFLPGILFRGQNLLLCKPLLFSDQLSGGEEQKSLKGATPCGRESRLQTVLCEY